MKHCPPQYKLLLKVKSICNSGPVYTLYHIDMRICSITQQYCSPISMLDHSTEFLFFTDKCPCHKTKEKEGAF